MLFNRRTKKKKRDYRHIKKGGSKFIYAHSCIENALCIKMRHIGANIPKLSKYSHMLRIRKEVKERLRILTVFPLYWRMNIRTVRTVLTV